MKLFKERSVTMERPFDITRSAPRLLLAGRLGLFIMSPDVRRAKGSSQPLVTGFKRGLVIA